MILNAKQVRSLLTNTHFGAEAQHGFDCTVAKIAAMRSELIAVKTSNELPSEATAIVCGAVLYDKTHPAALTYLQPTEFHIQRMGTMTADRLATRTGWALQKGSYSVTFNEGGELPNEHCGWFQPRSSIIRTGNDVRSGLYDAGFKAEQFGAILIIRNPVFIELNARIAQFVVSKAVSSELYNGQWQDKKDHK